MNIEFFQTKKHFAEASKWWKFWRWNNHPTPEILSDIGYVIEKDGVNLCMGWLYTTNSMIGSMEFIISNPEVSAELRSEALDFLVEVIAARNRGEGKKILMTSIKHAGLGKRLERLGFIKGDQEVTQFVRV